MRIPPLRQLVSIVSLACMASACTAPDDVQHRYMAAYLGDVRIGYSVHSRAVFGDRVVTTQRSALSLKRPGREEITCQSHYQFTETADGRPISFRAFETRNGQFTRSIIGHVTNGQLKARMMVDGEWENNTFPWPDDALLPEGLLLLRQRQGLADGVSYTEGRFDARSLTTLHSQVTVGRTVPVDILETVVELTSLQVTRRNDSSQEGSVEYVDGDFNTVKSVSPLLGTQLIYVTCDKAVALRPTNPLEQVALGSVASPVALTPARRATALTYTIQPNGAGKLLLPTDNTQFVADGPDGQLQVTVTRTGNPPAGVIPYVGEDEALLVALVSDSHIQPDNPRIAELAGKAVGDVTDARQAAKLLERYVFIYVNRGEHYAGYGTAAEVVQSRRGDCTEHAVLLAAMCRAVGLPAQVVSGLAYTTGPDGIGRFVSHAWVRAWVGGEWLHLDSTRKRVDAGSIMLAVGDEGTEGFPSSMDKFGRFKIVAIAADGEPLAPPETPDDARTTDDDTPDEDISRQP